MKLSKEQYLLKLIQYVQKGKLSLIEVRKILSFQDYINFSKLYLKILELKQDYVQISTMAQASVIRNYAPIVAKYKKWIEGMKEIEQMTDQIRLYSNWLDKIEFVESVASINLVELAKIKSFDFNKLKQEYDDPVWQKDKLWVINKIRTLKRTRQQIWDSKSMIEKLQLKNVEFPDLKNDEDGEVFDYIDDGIQNNDTTTILLLNNIL